MTDVNYERWGVYTTTLEKMGCRQVYTIQGQVVYVIENADTFEAFLKRALDDIHKVRDMMGKKLKANDGWPE